MDFTTSKKAVTVVKDWFLRNTNVNSCAGLGSENGGKIRPAAGIWNNRLPRTTPESVGISSEYLLKFYNRLQRDKDLNMQTVTISRGGYVISQGEFFPYKADMRHVSHSMCKSLISLCIGILCDDGIITVDDRVVDILADSIPQSAKVIHRNITVKNLLTMSTGIRFNEAGSVTDIDWVKAFFESTVKFKPGTGFEYNSMNTYILSAIICKVTGKSVTEFLNTRFFNYLGIKDFFWETCPMGIEKGGWGLYFYPEDMIRVGQMMLNGGVYNGKRIISEKYLKEAMTRRINTPQTTGVYDYGYQMWVKADDSVCMFNGMFGQNLILFPKIKLIIMMTAGNDEIFQRCPVYGIIERYFGGGFRPGVALPENEAALKQLRETERCLCKVGTDAEFIRNNSTKADIPHSALSILGDYSVDEKAGYGLSLMPELYQGVHNNFTKGMTGLSFSVKNGIFTVTFHEADGDRDVPVGFDRAEAGVVCYGEVIPTLAYGATVGDKIKKLRIHICFPELPNVRVLTVYPLSDGSVSVKWGEEPGYKLAYNEINITIAESLDQALVKRMQNNIENKFFIKRLKYFLQPVVIAKKIQQ